MNRRGCIFLCILNLTLGVWLWNHCCRHGLKSMTYNCSIGIFWFTASKFCTLTRSRDLHPQCVAMLFALCCCVFCSASGTFSHIMSPLPKHHGNPNCWSKNSPRCPLTKFQTGLRYKLKIWDTLPTSQRRWVSLCLVLQGGFWWGCLMMICFRSWEGQPLMAILKEHPRAVWTCAFKLLLNHNHYNQLLGKDHM